MRERAVGQRRTKLSQVRYEDTPGASMKSVAAELGINRNTLKNWLGRFSSNPRASTDASSTVTDHSSINVVRMGREDIVQASKDVFHSPDKAIFTY